MPNGTLRFGCVYFRYVRITHKAKNNEGSSRSVSPSILYIVCSQKDRRSKPNNRNSSKDLLRSFHFSIPLLPFPPSGNPNPPPRGVFSPFDFSSLSLIFHFLCRLFAEILFAFPSYVRFLRF